MKAALVLEDISRAALRIVSGHKNVTVGIYGNTAVRETRHAGI
jgi:hypothetical protein